VLGCLAVTAGVGVFVLAPQLRGTWAWRQADRALEEHERTVPATVRLCHRSTQVRQLQDEVRQLKALLGRHAGNSSLPPSANPPAAPPPVHKPPSARRRGAQPNHPPHLKQLLPPERVTRCECFVPTHCRRCQAPLAAQAGPDDPAPTRFQVADLPPVRAQVTEYQGHGRCCPRCGEVTWQPIPAEHCRHSIGPGLAAATAYLAGCHQGSKRGLEEIVETLFEVPVALGTISHLEQEVSQALAAAHAEAVQAVQQAPVKHADEIGWKKQGTKCWLWVAATAQVAAFVLHAGRGLAGLAVLLGAVARGIVISDRWCAYRHLPIYRRQLCWAHLRRDFQGLIDLGGEAKRYGTALDLFAEDVFTWWYRVRDGTLRRASMRTYIEQQRPWLRTLLAQGSARGCAKAAALCGQLQALEPALWTFLRHEGVAPTNNHAERVLRKAVLWRKKSFGCVSEGGCRFVERILTVVQTLRLQRRQVWHFLQQSITAHRAHQTAPSLLMG
jgi:transposase